MFIYIIIMVNNIKIVVARSNYFPLFHTSFSVTLNFKMSTKVKGCVRRGHFCMWFLVYVPLHVYVVSPA